jgi:AcrR family transcriptional regulator
MQQNMRSSQTKTMILEAANRLLRKAGSEGFTLEAVAAEAGVSKGGLLYHFASKNVLIEGMIAHSIERVDEALAEELERENGDYLKAYIRASFRTTADSEQVSRAFIAAIARNPALLDPLRERFERMQREIIVHAPSVEFGTLVRLAMDGLWFTELYHFAPPSVELRDKLLELLLRLSSEQIGQEGKSE